MAFSQKGSFKDPSLPIDVRTWDLLSRLTLEEKVNQMMYNDVTGVPRLNVPAYNWWNEALHGVGRSARATIFPQAIGLAATFDDGLAFRIADAVSDEARAIYNVSVSKGYRQQYSGLSFWTPNINIFRDPRWGRGQETYGEDPYLTSRMGVAYMKGLQGNHPKYLKTAACAKHYAVHSGPERLRHEFNATASQKDLWETYLPAFKKLVDNGVESVMCAYNSANGEPCCGNQYLLQDVLRKKWNFKGHIVSDCWALVDLWQGHKVVDNPVEAAALALRRGVNLNCGSTFPNLVQAVKQGLVRETEIDSSLAILLRTKFKLGMFDPKAMNPYDKINESVINNTAHRTLAREVATKSIVLLKNNGILPLKNDLSKYFVTGPNAASIEALIGNYYGVNDHMVTILEGITHAVSPASQVHYRAGVELDRPNVNSIDWSSGEAGATDVTIMVMGITGFLEGEEGESIASPSFGDRLDYNIPQNQIDYLKKLKSHNKPVIAVITGGSPMNLQEVNEIADAVVFTWYGGEEGGHAVADVLFGKVSPSGRLPITFPKSLEQLPDYNDYAMKGRTYRYMSNEPLYTFGYGLSYSIFDYSDLTIHKNPNSTKPYTISVKVTNSGKMKSDEIAQLYISHPGATDAPFYSLKGMKRLNLSPGTSALVSFDLQREDIQLINEYGEMVYHTGESKIIVGGASPGARSKSLGIHFVDKMVRFN